MAISFVSEVYATPGCPTPGEGSDPYTIYFGNEAGDLLLIYAPYFGTTPEGWFSSLGAGWIYRVSEAADETLDVTDSGFTPPASSIGLVFRADPSHTFEAVGTDRFSSGGGFNTATASLDAEETSYDLHAFVASSHAFAGDTGDGEMTGPTSFTEHDGCISFNPGGPYDSAVLSAGYAFGSDGACSVTHSYADRVDIPSDPHPFVDVELGEIHFNLVEIEPPPPPPTGRMYGWGLILGGISES